MPLISLIATLAPVIAPQVIKLVEHIFGPKTGSVKKPVAIDILNAIGDSLSKAGKTGTASKDDLGALVDSIVGELNKSGSLANAPLSSSPVPSSVLPSDPTEKLKLFIASQRAHLDLFEKLI